MSIASLAMYPFAHLRESYDQLWDAVRARLSFEGPPLDWNIDAEEACRHDDLLIGQTCGWPLITQLADSVHVVGTFDVDVDGAVNGTYRSVIVGRADEPFVDVLSRPDLIVAVNSADSLSGWISLQAVAKDHGVRLDRVDWTGSHAASVDAVRVGVADVASIDAVSWAHLGARGLFVIGRGPLVPCLPVVTARSSSPAMVAELRAAFATAVADPMLAGACASLKIRGFAPRDLADYKGLSALAQLG
jgi:ABC-type phosphate/phosphonate transport system substrate-binding protein